MRAEELAFINELKDAAVTWYSTAGPGVDVVALGFDQLVGAADKAAAPYGDVSESLVSCRWDAVTAMRKALRLELSLRVKRIQASRKKVVGRKNDGFAYELRTVHLISEQFDSWYAEGGLWNLVGQLLGAAESMHRITETILKDESIEREKRLFIIAFETRNHFGLVPPEYLGALEMLGNEIIVQKSGDSVQMSTL